MKQIFHLYLRNYYHLSLSIILLISFTYSSAGSVQNWYYTVWAGLATFFLYNYHSSLSLSFDTIKRTPFLIFLLAGSIFAGFVLLKEHTVNLLFLFVACFFSFGYFRSLLPVQKPLREYILIKPLMIGLVFAVLTALIPYIQIGYSISESAFLAVSRLCFVFALSITFDIGDIKEDSEKEVITIPQKIGITKSKVLACSLLLIAGLVDGYHAWIFLIEFPALIVLYFTYIYTGILILFSGIQRPFWYYLLLVDGALGLPWLLSIF